MSSSALPRTESGHAKFREGNFEAALELYSQALAAASADADRIALHSNRAACYLKLKKFKQAAAECSAVLELDEKHKGALMLRAQTLVMLKDYHSALFDVNRLLEIDPSSEVYENLKSKIKTQLALAPIPEAENESSSDSVPNSPMTRTPRSVASPAGSGISTSASNEWTPGSGMSTPDSTMSTPGSTMSTPSSTGSTLSTPGSGLSTPGSTISTSSSTGSTVSTPSSAASTASTPGSRGTNASTPASNGSASRAAAPSKIDYSRWNNIGDDLSDDEQDEDDQPQYKYRLKSIALRAASS